MKMAKLTTVRITLILLQLTSMAIASVIIIIYYNPWIGRIIDEAERSGNTGRSLADQIRRTDNEELVIFLMSSTTILVSLLGIIGTLRNYEHNHCLLNFYMSTLIIFLFVIFVALCGTVWQVFGKLHKTTPSTSAGNLNNGAIISFQNKNSNLNNNNNNNNVLMENTTYLNYSIFPSDIDDRSALLKPISLAPTTTKTATLNAQSNVTWWYIGKSLILIICSAAIYAASFKLTRKILESSDDRYLSANECEADIEDDLNSEQMHNSHQTYPYTNSTTNSSRYPYYTGNIADIYHGHMIGSSKSSLGSQFRTIL